MSEEDSPFKHLEVNIIDDYTPNSTLLGSIWEGLFGHEHAYFRQQHTILCVEDGPTLLERFKCSCGDSYEIKSELYRTLVAIYPHMEWYYRGDDPPWLSE